MGPAAVLRRRAAGVAAWHLYDKTLSGKNIVGAVQASETKPHQRQPWLWEPPQRGPGSGSAAASSAAMGPGAPGYAWGGACSSIANLSRETSERCVALESSPPPAQMSLRACAAR